MGVPTTMLKMGAGGSGVGALGVGAAAAGAITGNGEKTKGWWVPDGFEAVRTRFGRVVYHKHGPYRGKPKVHGPGFHPTIPFSHANRFMSVQNQTGDLGQVPVGRGGKQTVVHIEAIWGVKDSAKAWLKVKDGQLERNAIAFCGDGLRMVMATLPWDYFNQADTNSSELSAQAGDAEETALSAAEKEKLDRQKKLAHAIFLKAEYVCGDELGEIGIELRGIKIRSDSLHPLEILKGQDSSPATIGAIATEQLFESSGHGGQGISLMPVAGA